MWDDPPFWLSQEATTSNNNANSSNEVNATGDSNSPPDLGKAASAWSSWFVNTAESLINTYSKDLVEGFSTITQDTSQALSQTEKYLQREILGDTENTEVAPNQARNPNNNNSRGTHARDSSREFSSDFEIPLSDPRLKSIKMLQLTEETYTKDPENKTSFEAFQQSFKVDQHTEEISKLVSENKHVGEFYQKLVPMHVPYILFWKRYFFKLDQLNRQESRRQELLSKVTSMPSDIDEPSWEDDAVQETPRQEEQAKNSSSEHELSSQYHTKQTNTTSAPASETEMQESSGDEQRLVATQPPIDQPAPDPLFGNDQTGWDEWE